MEFPKTFFVTGTSTDIGKTMVSAVLVAGLKAHYWKPVQTGNIEPGDTDWIKSHTRFDDQYFHPETYSFREPLSPHLAAELEGAQIDMSAFELPEVSGSLVVEGAGGLLVPLNDQHLMIDLMAQLQLPVLLVADSGLGTINHTLLSLNELSKKQLEVIGVVLNGPKNPENKKAIESFSDVKVVGELQPLTDLSAAGLRSAFAASFP
jgi:dethiobiotin synthetase